MQEIPLSWYMQFKRPCGNSLKYVSAQNQTGVKSMLFQDLKLNLLIDII